MIPSARETMGRANQSELTKNSPLKSLPVRSSPSLKFRPGHAYAKPTLGRRRASAGAL
jgi:hypothetical protein